MSTSQTLEVDYDPFAGAELARAVPTTEAQREVWLAVQLGPAASLAYNESITVRLDGPLQLAALQDALLALTVRHEAMRATFSEDGQSMLVAARGHLHINFVDLRGTSTDVVNAERVRLLAAAVETPFDLAAGPLARAQLLCVADDAHELVLTCHHIVCDGWSFGILARELMTLYKRTTLKSAPAIMSPVQGFGDYALAQLDEAHIEAADADLRYWLGRYQNVPPVLDLPADRQRRSQRSFESRREDLALDASLVRAVRAVGAKRGASLFATLFTTFAALISRLARSDDVVVGISAAGQAAEDQRNLVGHCVNLLPVRVGVDLERPLGALIADTSSLILDAYDHQSCTFGSLLKRLKLARDLSRPSLVSVVFNVDTSISNSELSGAGLQAELLSNPRHFENFELFLNASEGENGMLLELQYNLALFDRSTVQRWLTLYRKALERLAHSPDIVAADAFAPDESDELSLAAFNRTERPYEKGLRLGDLILRGMRANPDGTAVVFEGRGVSFRELEGLAWGVAARLREQGCGPGTLVGVCLERSIEMVVALVGVEFSGAAYVPLDPTLPVDRIARMAADAGLRVVLTRTAELKAVASALSAECAVLLLDTFEPAAPLPLLGTESDAAYVIFTSGSTGRPKGAMNAHCGIVNRLLWMQEAYGLSAGDRVLQKTPFTFDVSVWEFFWPLCTGATLVVARPEGHRDGGYLVDLICNEGITVMHFVPSMLRLFLDEPRAAACRSLRQVVCSGEALPYDLVERFFARLPGVPLGNLYGPTEAAVDVTVWDCRPGDPSGMVPIGIPIANTTMYVLDDELRPLPMGVPGELYIGGVQVGMGYVARVELTAERFLADPFRPGGRMYKTGDIARWRKDGALLYLGRADFQVKLRGYRIELGEIEAQLQRHPAVAACVVVTWEDSTGDVRLVAYAVPRAGAVDAVQLRDFLQLSLPEYMIPQHFVALPSMPLLTSGKVDRRALPAPVFEALTGHATILPPRTPIECQVLEAMEQILKLPGLGIRDDFFALGGHSLLAARLAARLNKEHGTNLPMRTVFESPTVEGLARAIDAAHPDHQAARQVIERQLNQHEAPLTVMQERIRFMEDLHPGRVVYNTPSAHRLKGPMDVPAFAMALRLMIQRQPSLRTFVALGEHGPVQRVLDELVLDLPFEDLSTLPEDEREAVLMSRLQAVIDRPMPISQAPLFRAALYCLAPQQHVFLFMPHHIIWDGWSFDLLYQELAALYPAALEGRAVTLPTPPVSYIDYAHWHRQWLSGDECKAQVTHWKRRYADIEAPRALPTDHPRRAGMTGAGAVEWVHVDKPLTERLRQVALDQGATLNMLVMAVYATMMSQALGSRSLVIGVPVRGRLNGEVESVMGFFNNLLPVHLNVEPLLPLANWVSVVKRELLDAFANQDVPFERLAGEPEIALHATKAGLYQSLFSFQDARDRERRWGPLAHSSVLVMQKGATEDFGLWLMEVPGGLEGGINYNADLFDATTARVFRERLVALLERVANSPGQTVERLLAHPGPDADAFASWVGAHQIDAPTTAGHFAVAHTHASSGLSAGQMQLATIWAQLLGIGIDQIGPQDNFFDLGGNSLLVMQAVAQAERQMGQKIDPRRYVFEPLAKLAVGADREADLARLWANLLGIDAAQIRPGDNFFDLGGSSLLVMRAVADAERELDLKIDPRRYVFETLLQLSVPTLPAEASATEGVPPSRPSTEASGLFSRVLGRFGRRS